MLLTDKHRHLLQVLADGQFHSGSVLAQALGMSRSAIWKHIQALASLGIEVLAVSGKGYRLDNRLSLLNSAEILAAMEPALVSKLSAVEIFDQCDSTNSYLMTEARQGAASGKVCLAEYQNAGRGRRGRHWISPFGHNIMLSILWRFELGTASIAGLSLAIGVGVVRALEQLGVSGVGLKWPNDIYWQGKKLGGILLEVSGEASGPCAVVVGLGLNVFVPEALAESIDQAWVDLRHITGHDQIDRNLVVASLLNALIPVLADYEQKPLQAYLDAWRGYDCLLDQVVTVVIHQQQIQGIVRGINDEGLLLLEIASGEVQAFSAGEISFNRESS